MVRTVIFDLDGTLYDYDTAHAAGFRTLSAYARDRLGIPPADFRSLHKQAMVEQERRMGTSCGSIHNRIIRFQIILEWTGRPVAHALEMTNLYWDTFLRAAVPYPGGADCLRALRAAGYRVGIGTNMTADYQYAKLDRLGLLSLIDFMLSSEEAGMEKPDPRFFARCVEKADCGIEDCVFVGDNPVHDVAGPLGAGMRAVWLRQSAPPDTGNSASDMGGAADTSGTADTGGTADRDKTAPEKEPGITLWTEVPPEAEAAPQISRLDQLPALLATL